MDGKEVIVRLIGIYQNELISYQKLLSLSHRQQELIQEDKLTELDRLLAEKDEVMKKIDDLELKLKPYKEAFIKALDLKTNKWLSQLLETKLATPELKDIVNRLRTVMKELAVLDKENQELMVSKKDGLMEEIGKVKQGAKVNKSYNNRVRIHSTFIDSKS